MKQIAVIGNHLPRRCGIATFTADLCRAISGEFPEVNSFVIPVNDCAEGYPYPPSIRFEIDQNDLSSYKRAADFLNMNHVDTVCLQHEYGIYGGPSGNYILSLLRELRVPVVTTLHTILREPSAEQKATLQEIAALSDRLVVMSRRGACFLQEIYGIPSRNIDVIPHGIPDVPFIDPNFYKDEFGVEGKQVMLTFGLLSANKGLEQVIDALPAILKNHPDLVYMIVGATHPAVKRHEGEAYRESLQERARTLGVSDSLMFVDRFVDLDELVEYIGTADIYITPYLNREQICSGTLAYALGMGKAVISTPYWYAEELLADDRGLLVPFGSPEVIADGVTRLLENETERHAMRKRAYMDGREMTWPVVAEQYMNSFRKAYEGRLHNPRPVPFTKRSPKIGSGYPALNLNHLQRLTDDTGILQHSTFSVPNYDHGYTTDDNARALITAIRLEERGEKEKEKEIHALTSRYMAFLRHAFNAENGRFRNFMSYDRSWLEECGSEDSHGRTIWALGTVVGRSPHAGLRSMAGQMLELALPATLDFTSPRAWAYTLLGLHEYFKKFAGDSNAHSACAVLEERLMECYRTTGGADWPWFENVLSYCNARLSQALLLSGKRNGDSEMFAVGLESLRWLASIQRAEEGHFVPIGSNGFYPRGGEKARFDQQPVEAYTMVSVCLDAWRLTGDHVWYREARCAFDWFLGRNDLNISLYDPVTGGCFDGLHPDRVNQNQGAESTISFLLSQLEMEAAVPKTDFAEDVEKPLPRGLQPVEANGAAAVLK